MLNLLNVKDSVSDYINDHDIDHDIESAKTKMFKERIIRTLLNYEIKWDSGIPYWSPLNTLENLFNVKLKRHMMDIFIDQLSDSISLKTIWYTNNGEPARAYNPIIYNMQLCAEWLLKRRIITRDKYNELTPLQPSFKYVYKISQSALCSKLIKELKYKDLDYHLYHEILANAGILTNDEETNKYVATKHAKQKGYIYAEKNYKIWFTEDGEKAVTNCIKDYFSGDDENLGETR